MKRILPLLGLFLLAGCGGETPESAESTDTRPATVPATAPGTDVGATGPDATASPVAGDTSATNAAHP